MQVKGIAGWAGVRAAAHVRMPRGHAHRQRGTRPPS